MRPENGRSSFVPAPLWLAAWLALPLVASKAAHWDWPPSYGLGVWARDVYVSSHADVAFAVGFGVLAALVLAATRRWPWLHVASGRALLATGAFCTLYAVASVQIFDYLRSPLTYPLLYLTGDMGSMRSSIRSFVSPAVGVALVLAPIGYCLAVWRSSRAAVPPFGPARRVAALALAALAGGWAVHGASVAAGPWSDRSDVLIARSPHYEFVSSALEELRGGGLPELKDSFPSEFLEDFRPGLAKAARPVPAAVTVPNPAVRGARPRNVLVVVLESTGTRYLGLYGSPYRTTPHLDAEAAHALVFDNYYCHVGLTANSLASMMLSVYPYMTWKEYTVEYPDFPGTTLAAALKPHGYRTAYMTSAFIDYVNVDEFLQGRGFDEMKGWTEMEAGEAINSWGGPDGVVLERALRWIDQDRTKPFYAVVWTDQTHHPYDPVPGAPEEDFFAGRPRPEDDYDLGRYLNTLADVDRQLGRLFAGLRERGLDEDTVVVVTGDHGEAFGEPHPTWGHGFRLYQESVRVPLMVWSPALFGQGRRVATVGGHVDLTPTLMDLLGHEPDGSWEGHSLFAADRPPRAYFYAANDQYLLGVREGAFKYVYNVSRGREELFDLARDPDEKANVASAHPEKCRVLRQRLAAWRRHAADRLARARNAGTRSAQLSEPAPGLR